MQNTDYSNISITISSESEDEPYNQERDLFEITCNELLTINTVKNFPLQDNRINIEQLSYDMAIDYVKRLLRFRINFSIKRKKQYSKYQHNQDQKNHLLDVIQQLVSDKVKDSAIASIFNLSAQRTKFLKQSLRLRQFFSVRFQFENIHECWITEYVKTSPTYQTINSDDIYMQFLKKLNIASNQLTKTRFISFMKQCNITYKSVKFRKLRDLSISKKETVAQFCQQVVFYKQKGFKLLYLDETTFSRRINLIKCGSLRNQIKFIKLVS